MCTVTEALGIGEAEKLDVDARLPGRLPFIRLTDEDSGDVDVGSRLQYKSPPAAAWGSI